jgi:ferredoxin
MPGRKGNGNIVDEDTCIGCGLCTEICPVVFELVGGAPTVKVDPIPTDEKTRCRDATDACPVDAISIED